MAGPIKITLGSLDGSIKTAKVMNKLAASAVTSVAGRVGDVVLSQYDVGLGNLNNTSDLNKPISTATQNALDSILLSGANVNADWDAVGGASEIFNKPAFGDITGSSIADFATSDQGVLADSAIQSISSNTGVIIDDSDPINIIIDVTGAVGPQGPIGPIGPSGLQGPIGPSGLQGLQGDIGPSGLQGLQGDIGPSGLQGLQGDIGPSGLQGLQGDIGPSGLQGLQGDIGPSGLQGLQGDIGPSGLQGLQGDIGPSGLQGLQGDIGPSGLQGLQGDIGPSGLQGLQGDIGPSGLQGLQGDIGPSGLQGLQGDIGPSGLQGLQGDIGPSGLQGLQGDIGPSGLQGLQGDIGPSGLQGLQGDIGPSGLQGLQGDIGPSGAIGLTGPSGADAVVDNTAYGISWSGDTTQAATRDALYNEIEILPRFGDDVSEFNNDALYISSGDNVSDLANDAGYLTGNYQLSIEKGSPSGYASLDAFGKVPSSELPSYVDDVLEYADFASLPVTGESGKIYVTVDDGKIYRWTGSIYVEISADAGAPVSSVNTLIGAVVLDPDNLDDTSTTNKFTTQAEIDKLSGIAPNAEVNVNADWGSVGGDSEILNKPAFGDITGSNIADFATSGQGDLADTALQSSDNVSLLVNDTGYLLSGDNISLLANNALYVASGDNVSDLANDALYVASGDNVSDLVNDALYVASGDNVSDLVNDAGYITSADTFGFKYRSETGNYTVVAADYTIDCISGDQTITMLDATTVSGQIFVVKNSSPSVITITGTSSQTFDGNASVETNFPQSLTLQSTNTNWIII